MRRISTLAAAGVVALMTACSPSGDGGSPSAIPSTSAPSPSSQPDVGGSAPPALLKGSAAEELQELCVAPTPVGGKVDAPDEVPPDIAEIVDQAPQVRGLEYVEPVIVDPITQAEMDSKLREAFDDTYPVEFYERRSRAWQTIGVIPPDASIRDALLAFQTGQVVGFYNPTNGELVFLGDDVSDLSERFTLAHELTHAIDDQHFDLSRLDGIAADCRDETFQAALGAVEGSAQHFATQLFVRFPDDTLDPAPSTDLGGLDEIPGFIVDQQLWPYGEGVRFIAALTERGGTDAVNAALTEFPASTEQVIHPEKLGVDDPTAVDVPDLGPALGASWGDLDVMEIGEAWLQAMLRSRGLGDAVEPAAAGWDGGAYRAWTDGSRVAVVLRTVWDSQAEADEFAGAAQSFLDAGEGPGTVLPSGDAAVNVLFASDGATLEALANGLPSAA